MSSDASKPINSGWIVTTILIAAILGALAGANLTATIIEPKTTPETWCPKHLLGFYLVAERLELEAFPRAESSFGTLTCKLERKRPVEEIQREVEAKDHPPAKGKKR